jgi:hypothetical protein
LGLLKKVNPAGYGRWQPHRDRVQAVATTEFPFVAERADAAKTAIPRNSDSG